VKWHLLSCIYLHKGVYKVGRKAAKNLHNMHIMNTFGV